jgi:uncharacterized membrane protein
VAPSAKERDGLALRVALASLAALGLAISAYLTWTHFAGVAPACAGGSHGCETVQSSRYATFLGIPVSVVGLAGYAALLFSVALPTEGGVYLGFFLALVGTLFSAYLTYLELFVVRALCQWCLASAAVMVAALICATLGVWRLANERG